MAARGRSSRLATPWRVTPDLARTVDGPYRDQDMSSPASRGRLAFLAIPALAAALSGCAGGTDPAPQTTTGSGPVRTETEHPKALTQAKPKPIPGPAPLAGLQDDRVAYWDPTQVDIPARIAMAADLGAKQLRVDLPWWKVAVARPKKPTDPKDPAYDWKRFDQIVAEAKRHGIEVLFSVWGTPAWARDPAAAALYESENARGRGADVFAIRPANATDYGAFAIAAATRYVPQGVLRWEGWNEPNIIKSLLPQFEARDGAWVNVSAAVYSDLQKAFYTGIKSVAPNAEVAGLSTAPAGDTQPKGPLDRTLVATFLQELNSEALRPPMDVVSHHPYPAQLPTDKPFAGASYIDLYNLDRLESALDAGYLAGRPLWLTEFGFPTEAVGDYPFKVSESKQAEYLSDAYRRVRTDPRVKLLTWFFLSDNQNWKSGLTTQDGRKKPAYQAFSLPFSPSTTKPVNAGTPVLMSGQVRLAKGATTVSIEQNAGGSWTALKPLDTKADGSFVFQIRPSVTTKYRAKWLSGSASRESLPVEIVVS